MAEMAQTLGPLPLKSSILSEIFSSEIVSVIIGFLIFYCVQTRFLSRWNPSTRPPSKLVQETVELPSKSCDSPTLSPVLESVPGPTQASVTTISQSSPVGEDDNSSKVNKAGSFFADRHQQRHSHLQNFRPSSAISHADSKPASGESQKMGSFFADRQQQWRGHIQNFKPPAPSHRSGLGPTGPPPGLESKISESALPNVNDSSERPRPQRRVERRPPVASDPLAESLGSQGFNGNEEALLQLWTNVMSIPKTDAAAPTVPQSSAAMTGRGRSRIRPHERKRF